MVLKFFSGLACLFLMGAAGVAPAQAQQKTVSVLAFDNQPGTEAMRDGIRDALKAGGFAQGKALRLVDQSAEGDDDRLTRIVKKAVADRSDVIVTISAPAAAAAMAATRLIPVVYTGVDDPAESGLTATPGTAGSSGGGNVTGVSGVVAPLRQLDLLKSLVPGARRVGVVYTPAQAATVQLLKQLQDAGSRSGVVLVEVLAPRPVDVGSAARSLIGKVDVIYTVADVNVSKAYEALVKVANDARIPLVATDLDGFKRGAMAAIFVSDRDVGLQAGRMVVKFLRGARLGSVAPEVVTRPQIHLNLPAAQKQGVTFSDAVIKGAERVQR